jgi:prepilin-type N-terminal cleavage/methylation domain-containing protein
MCYDRSDRRVRRGDRGVTLLEILISSALFAFVMGGVYLLYTTMLGTMNRGELAADIQQNARVGLSRMVQEIQMAGYDPSGAIPAVALAPKDAIRAASPSCFSFVAYQWDPSSSPPTEVSYQITYALSGTTLRREAGKWVPNAFMVGAPAGGAQPLAENVDRLEFTYYDQHGQRIGAVPWASTHRCPPVAGAAVQTMTQLDFKQLRLVRRVGITLRTRDTRPGVSSEFFTLSADVHLRNR